MVDAADDIGITFRYANDVEIIGRLKVLEKILAGLGSVAVVDAERNVLDVEVHGVAEDEELDDGYNQNNQQASGITHDLQHFLAGDCDDARPAHAATPLLLTPRVVVSDTNTSSRLGAIC